jgi:hypothetical protein
MSTVRIALANVGAPSTADESVVLATSAVAEAGRRGALVIFRTARCSAINLTGKKVCS